jgi:hypothetical protein
MIREKISQLLDLCLTDVRRVVRATAFPDDIDGGYQAKHQIAKERPLRYNRTTGLTLSQMQELVRRVHDALTVP